ncbi:hypothetical protein ACFXDE_19525 [Kitasatospora sp. NPDC059408]|uniref:hypothetical protein n=1 Tax=Kitasatospora sp. NPDC059408 TaxID=3346823 RepID=UPI003698F5C0
MQGTDNAANSAAVRSGPEIRNLVLYCSSNGQPKWASRTAIPNTIWVTDTYGNPLWASNTYHACPGSEGYWG